jgi:hypothetical protein
MTGSVMVVVPEPFDRLADWRIVVAGETASLERSIHVTAGRHVLEIHFECAGSTWVGVGTIRTRLEVMDGERRQVMVPFAHILPTRA